MLLHDLSFSLLTCEVISLLDTVSAYILIMHGTALLEECNCRESNTSFLSEVRTKPDSRKKRLTFGSFSSSESQGKHHILWNLEFWEEVLPQDTPIIFHSFDRMVSRKRFYEMPTSINKMKSETYFYSFIIYHNKFLIYIKTNKKHQHSLSSLLIFIYSILLQYKNI